MLTYTEIAEEINQELSKYLPNQNLEQKRNGKVHKLKENSSVNQHVKAGNSIPLLCSLETTQYCVQLWGAQHKGHGPAEVGPEEGYEDDQRLEHL